MAATGPDGFRGYNSAMMSMRWIRYALPLMMLIAIQRTAFG
jgi:hypothetical protein